jgi:hypothetical protein
MLRKTNYLSDYFVTASGADPEIAFEKAKEALKKNDDNEVQNTVNCCQGGPVIWHKSFTEPYWMNCEAYFNSINPIQKPFNVAVNERIPNRASQRHIKKIFDEEDMNDIQKALNEEFPYPWPSHADYPDSYGLYLFGSRLWQVSGKETFLGQEELRLVFLEMVDKERKRFERLKSKFSGVAGQTLEGKREQIPEEVRIFVWRRDEGKCVKCGSQEDLEFDHVIPVAKGGGNTARNIQILCEKCNREKSANIM